MSSLFALIWIASLVAFIIYWRKKASARKAAGENYENDEAYQSVSKTKRIIGIVCIVSFVLTGALAPKSDDKTVSTTPTTPVASQPAKPTDQAKPKQETTYAEADIDVLLNDAKSNAAKANKNYKGKNVKIVGGHVSNIESEGRYIVIEGADRFSLLHVQCYPKNKESKDAMLEVSKGQPITVYGKITDVGEIMGYSLDLVKIE